MKLRKLVSVVLVVPIASTFILFNSQSAQAGCGWGDITCPPDNWTCPIGGCPAPPPQSTVGRDMTSIVPLWIDNHSGQTVMTIHLSPVSSSSWGQDILGQDVLGVERRWNTSVRDEGGCLYDFEAILRNGDVRSLRNFNACAVGGVNILR